MELIYLWSTTAFMLFLGVIWSNKNWYNVLAKVSMIILAILGIILLLKQYGFLIKT